MSVEKITPVTLIRKLYDAGAISLKIPSYEIENDIQIEVALQEVICRDPIVRMAVARMFNKSLRKMFPDPESDQKRLHPEIKRVMENRYGCVGTHAIAAIMGLLPCPIVTIAPDTLSTPKVNYRGKLGTDHPYVLVDDLIQTGETLSKELAFLLHLNYKIDTITVFYDRNIGGQEHIRAEYKKLSNIFFGKEQEIKIKILMPRERIISLLKEAKIIISKVK